MNLSRLIYLIGELNRALDTGKYQFTKQEIQEEIEKRNLFGFLKEQLGQDMDLSPLEDRDKEWLSDKFVDFVAIARERRYFGAENNGLCLLIGYTHLLHHWETKF